MTLTIGVFGALAGGLLYSFFQGALSQPIATPNHIGYSLVAAVLGAIVLLVVFPSPYLGKETN